MYLEWTEKWTPFSSPVALVTVRRFLQIRGPGASRDENAWTPNSDEDRAIFPFVILFFAIFLFCFD